MSPMGDDIARCLSAAQVRAVVVGIVKITGRCLCIYAELLSARLYRCLCWFTLCAICRDTLSPELLFRGRDGIRAPRFLPSLSLFPAASSWNFEFRARKKFLRPHSFPRQSNNQSMDSGKNIVMIIYRCSNFIARRERFNAEKILNCIRKEKINYLNNISYVTEYQDYISKLFKNTDGVYLIVTSINIDNEREIIYKISLSRNIHSGKFDLNSITCPKLSAQISVLI